MKKVSHRLMEEQLAAATDRINELEAALFQGGTRLLNLTAAILLNNVAHVVIATRNGNDSVIGVYFHEDSAITGAAKAREIYGGVRTEPWLIQGEELNGKVDLDGRAIQYFTGQKIIYEDKIEEVTGTATVLSADYEFQKSPQEILYKVVPEGLPFTDQYAKIVFGSEIRGFAK